GPRSPANGPHAPPPGHEAPLTGPRSPATGPRAGRIHPGHPTPPPTIPLPDPGGPRMPEAVIVDAIRTPIGRAVKGSLKTIRADDLAATALKALIERNPDVNFAETGDVMMGAASS